VPVPTSRAGSRHLAPGNGWHAMAVTEIVTHTLLQAATDRNMTRRRPACGEAQLNEMTNDAGVDGEN